MNGVVPEDRNARSDRAINIYINACAGYMATTVDVPRLGSSFRIAAAAAAASSAVYLYRGRSCYSLSSVLSVELRVCGSQRRSGR